MKNMNIHNTPPVTGLGKGKKGKKAEKPDEAKATAALIEDEEDLDDLDPELEAELQARAADPSSSRRRR